MANENIQELKFQVGEVWKGVYSSSTPYGLANVVQDPTGLSVYRSLKSGNVGHPLNNRTWWFCIIDMSSIKAESDRITALNQAIAQDEALRVAAEELRQQHEAERIAAETQRNEAEQARVNAEQERVGAESARATAEQQRITAEQERVSAESARVQAEQARVLSETLRANAEDQRAANEQNRIAAEQQRIERAESDHQRVESDLADIAVYTDSLGAFDLSKHNAVDGVLATYADLSAALTALNALDSKYKYGGMSFKFVLTSDNKYVQARCMAQSFTTDVTQWQGIDDEPTANSENLVTSGGVYEDVTNKTGCLTINKELNISTRTQIIYYRTNSNFGTRMAVRLKSMTCTLDVNKHFTVGFYDKNSASTYKNLSNIGDIVTLELNNDNYIKALLIQVDANSISSAGDVEVEVLFGNNYTVNILDNAPVFGSNHLITSDAVARNINRQIVTYNIPAGSTTRQILLREFDYGKSVAVRIVSNTAVLASGAAIKAQFRHNDGSQSYHVLSEVFEGIYNNTKSIDRLYVFTDGEVTAAGTITIEIIYSDSYWSNVVNENCKREKAFATLIANSNDQVILSQKLHFGKKVAVKRIVGDSDANGSFKLLVRLYNDSNTLLVSKKISDSEYLILETSDNIEWLYLMSNGEVSVGGNICIDVIWDEVLVNAIERSQNTEFRENCDVRSNISFTRYYTQSDGEIGDLATLGITSKDYIKAPFKCTVSDGYSIKYVFKYSLTNNVYAYLGRTSLNSRFISVDDNYYYKIEIVKDNNTPIADNEINSVVEEFTGYVGSIEDKVYDKKEISLGTITLPYGVETIKLNVPIKYSDISEVRIVITPTTADDTNSFYLYGLHGEDGPSVRQGLEVKLANQRNINILSSNGYESLYGIFLYNNHKNTTCVFNATIEVFGNYHGLKKYTESELSANILPSYYTEEYIAKKTKVIGNYIKDTCINGDSFFFVTDTHWEVNQRHSPALMKHLNKDLNIHRIMHGGDAYQESAHNAGVATYGLEIINSYRQALGSDKVYMCDGNHEYITYTSYSQAFSKYRMHLDDVVFGGTNKNYYYVDNNQKQLRYVFLATWGERSEQTGYVYEYEDAEQLAWIENIALNVPSGWGIIIFTHWLGSISEADNVTHVEVQGAQNIYSIVNNYNGNGTILAFITGHTHRDFVLMGWGNMDIPIIITTCDHNYNFEFQGSLGPYAEFDNIAIPRTSGTKEEQAFDVVVYDKESVLMHFIRIGSGADNKLNDIPAADNTQVECRSVYLKGMNVGVSKTLPTYLTGTLTWSSSDSSIVSVNDGVATTVATGCARINVTDGNETQSFYIKVK